MTPIILTIRALRRHREAFRRFVATETGAIGLRRRARPGAAVR